MLSIGLFFSLMIAGLAARLPTTLYSGLTANGVPPATAERIAHLPPVGSLFAAFLGFNPIRTLLGPAALARLSPGRQPTSPAPPSSPGSSPSRSATGWPSCSWPRW